MWPNELYWQVRGVGEPKFGQVPGEVCNRVLRNCDTSGEDKRQEPQGQQSKVEGGESGDCTGQARDDRARWSSIGPIGRSRWS
jgi:hypothetical protein